VTGYFVLSTTQVMCAEFTQCYDEVNICLWNDGSEMPHSVSQSLCQQRNFFLPRVTNSNIQSKLREYRSAALGMFASYSIWIDVKAVDPDSFHWIDGSSLAS